MTYRVEINDCLRQFRCAHNALIESLGSASQYVGKGQMQHNWQKLYGVKPVSENSHWKYLDFEDEKQYTLFILKWS